MISKEDYLSSVEAIDKFLTEDNEIFVGSNGVVDTTKISSLWDMVQAYVQLLETLTNDTARDFGAPGNLSTYLFDKESRKRNVGTPEDIYNNYIDGEADKEREEISPSTLADKLRNYSDEELANFLYGIYKTGRVSGKVVEKTKLTPEDILKMLKD